MNKVSKFLSNKACKLCNFITKHCAPYEVRCTYGTKQATWTFKEALAWVAMCEDITVVIHRATGEMVATRNAI